MACVHARRAPRGRTVATYPYVDERGELLFEVVRKEPKDFQQRQPDRKGGWRWNLHGVRRVPYRLPELLSAPADAAVFILEGEKDVDALRSIGLTATCNPCGAGKWRPEYSAHLPGRKVVIISDADEPGRRHADDVVRHLLPVAGSLRRLELPAKDASDWLAAGGSKDELLRLVDATAPVSRPARVPLLVRMSDVAAEAVQWLWHPRLPLGKVSMLAGNPGDGKSLFVAAVSATITRGGRWPDGTVCAAGDVVLLNAEDGAADTIRPRLDAAGADTSRVHLLTGYRDDTDEDGKKRFVTLADLDVLDAALAAVRPRFVSVDPVQAYLGSGADMHRANEMRPLLAALADLAERHHCAILVTCHLTKGSRDRAIYRLLGSIDFVAAARSVLLIGLDPNDAERRAVVHVKSSLAARAAALDFTIQDNRILWSPERCDLTAEELTAPDTAGLHRHTKTADAVAFLEVALAQGPRPYAELIAEAEEADLEGSITLRASKSSAS